MRQLNLSLVAPHRLPTHWLARSLLIDNQMIIMTEGRQWTHLYIDLLANLGGVRVSERSLPSLTSSSQRLCLFFQTRNSKRDLSSGEDLTPDLTGTKPLH
jgi:hypothetical protein